MGGEFMETLKRMRSIAFGGGAGARVGRYPLNRTAHGDAAAGQSSGGDPRTVDVPPPYQPSIPAAGTSGPTQAQRLSGVGFLGSGKLSCFQDSEFGKLDFAKLGYIRSPGLRFTSTIPPKHVKTAAQILLKHPKQRPDSADLDLQS